ncbi:MAG: sulfotransferase [Proteobacteria bacterium]|nr:sulfotransferase [Pseudomonadota bacterium]
MPDNYLLLGWLRIAFPQAAIIHCVRDPRDVAFSCWLTQFAAVPWSFDLAHIAARIEQHRRLMRHWRSLFGGTLTEVRYEDLVAHPEPQLRRALHAIGLDWHPNMLDFHEGRRFVGSASMRQVREPLNTRSVGRWRNYAEALATVLPQLDAVARQDEIELAAIDAT